MPMPMPMPMPVASGQSLGAAGFADRAAAGLRWMVAVAMVAAFAYYVAQSVHWTVVWDSAVMHYVNFLMDHGLRPYRDISDSNMPGAYLTERWAMRVFGGGDLAWRMYDYALSVALTAAFVAIAKPYDWMAGLYAGGFFAMLHGSEGPNFAVEREQVMTTLLAIGLACLFVSLRRQRAWLMVVFGLATGVAASIKPTCAPLAVAVLLAALWMQRRAERPVVAYLRWACVGMLAAAGTVVWFFAATHSFQDFLFVTRTLLPSYVATKHLGMGDLLRILLPRNMLLLLPFGLALALRRREWDRKEWNYERYLLLAAMLFGAVSFFAQRKGIIYHRYPFVAFLLLLLGLEFLPALRARGWRRGAAAAGVLLTLGVSLPHYVVELRRTIPVSALGFSQALTEDLRAMGPERLQRKVECFDLTDGCFSALYHLDLVQNNGFTGDLLFFSPTTSAVVEYYRGQFWQRTRTDPPEVFVLSNEWFQVGHTFRKLEAWPEFARYLNANYVEVISRAFPVHEGERGGDQPSRYRIYVRRGSALLGHAPFRPEPAAHADAMFEDGAGDAPVVPSGRQP